MEISPAHPHYSTHPATHPATSAKARQSHPVWKMADRQTQNGYSEVLSAVQTLVSALQQNLQQGQETQLLSQGQTPAVQRQTVAVQQEMSRSFPSLFQKQRVAGKRRFPVATKVCKVTKLSKPFTCTFCLLNENSDNTPCPSEELELFQAGLGRRCIAISEDTSYSELKNQLCEVYPKLEALTGGWLLHKALGGNGKRRLTLIPPDCEGYTGAQIKRATTSGKTCVYIVPLQEELDLNPLPADAKEFEKMPKAACKNCQKTFPLQVLALHVGSCTVTLSSSEHEEVDDPECPICQEKFSTVDLPLHASCCGERFENSPGSSPTTSILLNNMLCEDDVLRWLTAQIDHTKEFQICVARENLVERGMILWKRQKKGSPINPLKVTFLGEPGIDTGALRVEFLTEMISGIEDRLFEGQQGKGKIPKYSVNDLDSGLFRVAGEVFAVSLAQGGPAPCFLQEWCYYFLVTGELMTVTKDNVHDLELSPLIKRVEEAEDLTSCIEEIISCGYTGQINVESKSSIIRAILLHATMKRLPMLRQIREGLDVYNFVNILEKNQEHCRGLFVIGNMEKVDSHYILSSLAPEMSDGGTVKHLKEREILNYFQDFLIDLEDADPEGQKKLTVPDVLQWLTGQSHRHLLLSERQRFRIVVRFDHACLDRMPHHTVCYPVVSACTNTITFPTAHLNDFDEFQKNMLISIRYGAGFYRI